MIPLDLGVPPNDPAGRPADTYWTRLTYTGTQLAHVKSPADQLQARAGLEAVGVTTAELAALLENVTTVGPSPFGPGSVADNPALHAAWIAARGRV